MRITFLPDGTPWNPYQARLANALERRGLDVRLGSRFRVLPLLRGAPLWNRPHVLHLHWTHQFMVGRSPLRTLIKTLLFAFELATLRATGVTIIWTVHNLVGHESPHPRLERMLIGLIQLFYARV